MRSDKKTGNSPVTTRNSVTETFIALTVITAVNLYIYSAYLQERYAYLLYQPLELSAGYLLLVAIGLFFIAHTIPRTTEIPSDWFCLFYSLFVVYTFLLFGSVSHVGNAYIQLIGTIMLFAPLLVVYMARLLTVRIPRVSCLSVRGLGLLVFVLIGGATVLAVQEASSFGGFGMESAYERRIHGREHFIPRSLAAYALTIAGNGLVPLMAFMSGASRKPILAILAISASIVPFWAIGMKTPFVLALVFLALGVIYRNGLLKQSARYIVLVVLTLSCIALIELKLTENSIIADILIRRLFVIPAIINSYYFDYIAGMSVHDMLVGSGGAYDIGTTFYIGAEYLYDTAANANTNAFVYALASSGLIGIMFSVSASVAILWTLDQWHRRSKQGIVVAVAALFSALIIEQAYTTVLMSSGLGLCLLLVFIARPKEKHAR